MPMKKKIQKTLRICLIVLLNGCVTGPDQTTVPDVYLGFSKMESIKRNKTDVIKCADPKFDQFVCVKYDDFISLSNEVIYCRDKMKESDD